jgi:hypothetical protein
MTHKNPFEIRSEVLELAKDYLDKQIEMNIEYAEKMQELGKINSDEYMKAFTPYTFEELMTKAKEMYSFVSTRDK